MKANPADINILDDYQDDPRTVDKIWDGVNRTCDDMHVWLAPFTEGQEHWITITLHSPITISLIRFWVCQLFCGYTYNCRTTINHVYTRIEALRT